MTIGLLVCLWISVLSGLWKLAGICPKAWWEGGWWPCVHFLGLSIVLNSDFNPGCYSSAAHRRQGPSLWLPGVPAAQPTYPPPSEYLSRGCFDVHHTLRSMPLSCLITSLKGRWCVWIELVYELSFLLFFCGYFMGFVVSGIGCRD